MNHSAHDFDEIPKHKSVLQDKKFLVYMLVLIPVEIVFFQHIGALLCGLGYGMMILSSGILLMIFTVVIRAFGEMIFFPSSASYIATISPEEKRGEYMGYF